MLQSSLAPQEHILDSLRREGGLREGCPVPDAPGVKDRNIRTFNRPLL